MSIGDAGSLPVPWIDPPERGFIWKLSAGYIRKLFPVTLGEDSSNVEVEHGGTGIKRGVRSSDGRMFLSAAPDRCEIRRADANAVALVDQGVVKNQIESDSLSCAD